MAQPCTARVLEQFAESDDPRLERARRQKLVDIPAIAICAIMIPAGELMEAEAARRHSVRAVSVGRTGMSRRS